jgi:site-specific DNA-cytosine methylase
MKYLSLFSGIGGFEIGIHRVFPQAECVGYSEIDKNALRVYQTHFPKHPYLGEVSQIDYKRFHGQVDLVVGGFPCKDLTSVNCKRKKGLSGKHSTLFYEQLRCILECKPTFFIENVASMPKKERMYITSLLQVEPLEINSASFTAQRRKRLFWCNFNVQEIKTDHRVLLKDVLEPLSKVSHLERSETYKRYILRRQITMNGQFHDSRCEKSKPLLGAHVPSISDYRFNETSPLIRKFSPLECERLQGFPDHWTDPICNTYRYLVLGNAVTVPVVEHICQSIKCSMVRGSK